MNEDINLSNVSFSYTNGARILDGVNLRIAKGEFLGVTGVNGSGKTTLTYLLNGLIPNLIKGNLEGSVTVGGISTQKGDMNYFARKVGMLFQNPDFSIFNLTVQEEIEFGLKNLNLGKREERIREALIIAAITDFADRDPQTLSHGEKQKVCLAAVIALDTQVIVLDEPSASLDFRSSVELYETLKKLNAHGKTIVVVDHDTDFLWKYADKVLILHKGKKALYGQAETIKKMNKDLVKLGVKP